MQFIPFSAIYVELIQILGKMLRDGLDAQIGNERECFDIAHVSTWNTAKREPSRNASEQALADYYIGGTDKFTNHLYFVRGGFKAINFGNRDGRYEKVQIRVICQLGEWHEASLSQWMLSVWLKKCDGQVERHFFYSGRGYGGDCDMVKGDIPETMKQNPPERMSFPPPRMKC